MSELIRRARPGDEVEIVAMIRELAEFEHAADECVVTESSLHSALFNDQPTVHAHIVEIDGRAAATAVWFLNFSTWDGVSGIYLEDLYVRPDFRRRGLARKLLSTLAAECKTHGYTRLSWAVLNWNVNAIALYDAVGGKPQTEWTTYRVSGPELSALAAESNQIPGPLRSPPQAGGAPRPPSQSRPAIHRTADGLNNMPNAASASSPTRIP